MGGMVVPFCLLRPSSLLLRGPSHYSASSLSNVNDFQVRVGVARMTVSSLADDCQPN